MPPTTTCSALFTRPTPTARFITAMAAAFPSSPWAAWPRWEAKAEPTGAPPTATTCPLTRSSTTSAIKDSGSSPSTSSPVGKAVKESFADVLTIIDCDFNFYLRQLRGGPAGGNATPYLLNVIRSYTCQHCSNLLDNKCILTSSCILVRPTSLLQLSARPCREGWNNPFYVMLSIILEKK